MRKTWSVNNLHWESLPEEFLNGNWKKVGYVSNSIRLVPEAGGIYMYCVGIPKSDNEKLEQVRTPIYMGISKNLRDRFRSHLKNPNIERMAECFGNRLHFFHLKIDPYDEKDVRLKFEQPMIDCFGKVVNKIDSVKQLPELEAALGEFKPI